MILWVIINFKFLFVVLRLLDYCGIVSTALIKIILTDMVAAEINAIEAYLRPYQTSVIELFAKVVND